MAPALSDAARKPLLDGEPHPRRALTSVGNLSSPMEDEMGFQSSANLSKDSQDMEQMLVELGGTEIAQADLLQAIKTLEGGGDGLSTSDADAIFPLSSFERDEMLEGGDSESDVAEDKIRAMQAKLERRSCFLLRRMRMHQARAIGKRVSEQVVETVDLCGRSMRRDGTTVRPSGVKSALKRIETTAALQSSSAQKSRPGPSYYRVGCDSSAPSASLGIAPGTLDATGDTAAALRSHLRIVESHLDSDATASSSGAESNDEAVSYTNPYQEPLAIEQRALWQWQRRRAALAARWSWLQAQVQELEYKIRQHTDLHRQVRAAKGAVQLEGSPGGYEGPLPGQSDTCARVRPLKRDSFRKRKLLQMHNLHFAAPKAAKPADIRCGCQWPIPGCAVCTGREVATQPLPPNSTLTPAQKLALLDPGYHPVLSDIHDVSASIHMAALSSQVWWTANARGSRSSTRNVISASAGAHSTQHTPHISTKKRKHSVTKLKKNRVGRKSRDTDEYLPERERMEHSNRGRPPRDNRTSSTTDSTTAPSSRRINSSSYDIDNIVIPPSVAATTRLEILHYKEIPTPKWRVMDVPLQPALNNGHAHLALDTESEEEDISEASVLARHARAEQTERGKYARKKRTRRSNHQNSTESQTAMDGNGMSSGALLSGGEESNPCSEPPTPESNGPTALLRRLDLSPLETVRPYSPRMFPLEESTYRDMLLDMPLGHPLSCAELDEEMEEEVLDQNFDDDEPSSPMSPLFFEDDDPNDPEWDQVNEDKR